MIRTKLEALLVAFLLFFFANAGVSLAQTHWVASWAASQQLPEPQNSLATDDLRDATLRQIVRLSAGGAELRVHLSNRYGTAPLRFTSVHIARPVSPASEKIIAETDQTLTFSGKPDVIVPAGADYVSDPIAYAVAPQADLAITLHLDAPPAQQTGHPGSRATSYFVHGDQVSALELPDAKKVDHWYFISGVDVSAAFQITAVAVLGDSITDGRGSTTNGNNRWPDLLVQRLQKVTGKLELAVLNHGIGGNHLLTDGLGPDTLARFDHDVLAQAGIRYLIVLEGINDLGGLARAGEVPQAEHDALVRQIITAYEQIVTRARTHGITVIGATILPYVGSEYYHPGPSNEADRQAVNKWILTPGHFDAAIDFDKVTRDPEHPDRLLPAYDSGDHLHPSPAGYAAMAEAVPLDLFNLSASTAAAAAPPKIAITFDDLPAHGPLPSGTTRVEIATKILAALREANMPPVYGFVNGALIEKQDADAEVLHLWRNGGQPLGNHSWSHMNLNQHTLKEFQDDVLHNQSVVSRWMVYDKNNWHWFRFPFLAEGDTDEKRMGVRKFLKQRDYKIAGVTMSFGDYQWTDPYARCKAKGDEQSIALLKSSYLAAADESINYTRGLSHMLYGRDIPYVLLLHIGALDAEMMPQLLELYRSRGFQFVTLQEAESDEFYRLDTDLAQPPGPDTLEGVAAERKLVLQPRAKPPVQFDTMCR